MQTIIIDEEFKGLLPALNKEVYAALEESIILNGCRDAIMLWNGILIDGHNRYEICLKHDIPFSTDSKDFESREEALIWIITNQVARPNLTPLQLSHYRGLHYRTSKLLQGKNNQHVQKSEKDQNDPFHSTAKHIAEQYSVSPMTIKRDSNISKALDTIGDISPEAKRKLLSGEVTINKKELQELSSRSVEEIEELAARIEEGTFERRAPVTPTPEKFEEFDEYAPDDLQRLYAARGHIADIFKSELKKINKTESMAELKTVLRTCIDTLEDVYARV